MYIQISKVERVDRGETTFSRVSAAHPCEFSLTPRADCRWKKSSMRADNNAREEKLYSGDDARKTNYYVSIKNVCVCDG